MKKILLIILLIITFFSVDVYAANIDITKNGSIEIKYSYGNTTFSNKKVYLYKVANLTSEGKIDYTKEFVNLNSDIYNLNSSELNSLIQKISQQIEQKNIQSTYEKNTNKEGIAQINNIPTGIYLLKLETGKDKNYQYNTMPTLISIPLYDEINKQYKYELSVVSKTEAKYLNNHTKDDNIYNNSNTKDENINNVPNTTDTINIYITLFILSIICIIILLCYKKDGKEVKNEKNNK